MIKTLTLGCLHHNKLVGLLAKVVLIKNLPPSHINAEYVGKYLPANRELN